MYLKRLELQGFKSFAEKTVLEFKPGITSVIGPNGSGKSNISDSIRWVLGEQSMKSLRGATSSDIIFAGTQNRKSLGFAEASIVIDNTDGKLPIEYSEVTITRKIYRSGETGYYINKVPCRLKDILELFMDTGIGKDGYSIIGQGKIDEILSNKSEDRRRIFEEAAGIVKYRTRKLESEKKLEQTKLNLLRINDILSEIEGQIDPLKGQAEKAKQFLDLREELKSIEVGLFLYHIDTYKEKLSQLLQDIQILEEQKEQEDSKLEKIQELKEQLKQEIDTITTQIEEVQNIGFESKSEIEKANSEIVIQEERSQNNKANQERLEQEVEELKEIIQQLEQEKQEKKNKKENLFSNKERYEKELVEKEEELAKLTQKLSDKELEIEAKKKRVEENTEEKYEKSSLLSTQEVNYENTEKRERTVKTEMQATISELDAIRMNKQEKLKGYYQVEKEKKETEQELDKIVKDKQIAMQKMKEFDDAMNQYSDQYRMKESRYKFLVETEREKEGYTKSVKLLLTEAEGKQALKDGIEGVLANLISVEKEYETAIEMCLGQTLQNVVTQTEEDAKKCIEQLREKNLGRASFLPVSSIKGKKLDRLIKNQLEGVIGIASDLIKCDKKYEQIVLNLLGRTVIVDNMDTAIRLAKQNGYSFRIVTLKGDLVNPSGAITGGSVAQKTVNILGRSREIEELGKELKKLKNKIEEIQKQKEEYSSSIADTIENAAGLEKRLQEIDIVYATETQKIEQVEKEIQRLEERLKKQKDEIQDLVKQKEEIQQIQKQVKEEIKKLVEQIAELSEEIEKFMLLNKDDQSYMDNLNLDITNLKISVSSFDESGLSIEEMIQRIEQDVENNKKNIENKVKQKEEAQQSNQELQQGILELKQKIEQIKKEVENSGSKIQELKTQRIEKNEKLNQIEQQVTEQFHHMEDLKESLVKLEVKKTKQEQDLEQVINHLWEEYEITPNTGEEYHKPDNVQVTQKRVNELRSKIRDLGSINIDAIEEYKKLKERYDFMCEQRLDLDNSVTKLRKVISEMTETMKNQFTEKFHFINQHFNEVFIELFGGGKAELILEDPENILECGIDIRVQPPGKKLQNMMLLSGGEKAFTAIALLFAILRINPAPFCILDEIEAALDDVNVYRFAEYLKKFSKETQFLVITHRKGTMEVADTVYGVTMEENGISKLLSIKLK